MQVSGLCHQNNPLKYFDSNGDPFLSEQTKAGQNCLKIHEILQVGSFNYDNTKMVYRTYYLPLMPNSTESILDYEVEIASLKIEDTFYLPAETGNYSVAGFEMVLNR